MQMNIRHVGRAHHLQVVFFNLRFEEARDQILQNLLTDIAGEALANQRQRRLSLTEPLQLSPVAVLFGNFVGFLRNRIGRNRDLKLVLAAFH